MSILDGSFSGRPEDALDGLFAVPRFEVVAMGPGVSSTIGVDVGRSLAIRGWFQPRVIDSTGGLHGYGGGLDRKRALLELEGALAPQPSLFT